MLLDDQRADGFASVASGDPHPAVRARTLLAAGDLDQALAWSALARARQRGPGALLMAQVRISRQEPDQAAEALTDASGRIGASQVPELLAAYQALLQAQPGNPWLHAEHADALDRAGQPAEALAAYDHAISLAPGNPSLHFNKSDRRLRLGRLDEAASCLTEVIRLRPDDVLGAQVVLGAITWADDQDTARDHFAASLSSPGALLTPWTRALYRAIALAGLGRIHDAQRELETALPARSAEDADPDNTVHLLHCLQNPPLPGLDVLRALLEPPAITT
jgi:tetratricopeptide (TPR) repeat protein